MKRIIGAAVGNCVHVAGILNFFKLAEKEDFETEFLGTAVSIDKLINAVIERRPQAVGVSFRLTPDALKPILDELSFKIEENNLQEIQWLFGGTQPAAETAGKYPFFNKVFDGTEDIDHCISFLRGNKTNKAEEIYGDNISDRIRGKYPYPVLRHHFGLPSLQDTIEGVKVIADSRVLDVISLAPDQNAQEHFFEMEKAERSLDGAGGVPVRTYGDFREIYEASRRGNYPLLRCYSGTNDVFKFAGMLLGTIKNAWSAIPLCWYNVLDGRGPRDIVQSITENQKLIKWHGDEGVPVEVNESHHWSLRDAHDTIGVATAFLAAYNAKKLGVKEYIAQYMFNVPPSNSPKMDLAKMLAKIEMIESLHDENFMTYRQVRAGLASLPTDLYIAKGQLAASTYLSMAIEPHILHVVGYCEAHHAATPDDIIESCKIVRGVIRNCLQGMPDMTKDKEVQYRKNELIKEAKYLLKSLNTISPNSDNPWSDPYTIAKAIGIGILDAPHLRGNKNAKGTLDTRIINGACYAYDSHKEKVLTEKERIDRILEKYYSDAASI